MPKSNNATINQRIDDVTRLLVAGAEFRDICQFAATHGWTVSGRQVRRYMKKALDEIARSSRRKHKQLLGLQLQQRRALYARSVKENELSTAHQVLRDLAKLQGLYPSSKNSPATENRAPSECPLPLKERVARSIDAILKGDLKEFRFLEHVAPKACYQTSDAYLPRLVLCALSMQYVNDQLQRIAAYYELTTCLAESYACGPNDDDNRICQTLDLLIHCLCVHAEAWSRFAKGIGLAGQSLIDANDPSGTVTAFIRSVEGFSVSPEKLAQISINPDGTVARLPRVEQLVGRLRQIYEQATEAA